MENQGPYVSEKTLLRRSIRSRLRLMGADDRRERSLEICTKLARLLAGIKYIALFAPRPTEPDLDLLWGLGLLKDRLVAYPRCEGKDLGFFAVTGLHELHPGRFGIREPEPKWIAQDLDAIVIPGLAFTQSGIRIGQGAGFYDRFFESCRTDTVKIGVCFAFQIVPTIAREEHDVNVDLVVCA